MSSENWLVVGGGITGLVAAASLRRYRPDSSVVLVEQSAQLGGLLAGQFHERAGSYFDIGTHIFRETGVDFIDELLLSSMPKEEMLHYPPGQGDVTGAVYRGRLQTNTHFPDLRDHPESASLISSLRDAIEDPGTLDLDRVGRAEDHLRSKFGALVADSVLMPILSTIYQRNPSELAAFASFIPGLSRVVACNQAEWEKTCRNDFFRAVMACPDQRNLPEEYVQPLRSYYPRGGGTRSVVESLGGRLRSDGVRILLGSSVRIPDLMRPRVLIEDADGSICEHEFDGIVMAAGVFSAAKIAGLDFRAFSFDRPLEHRIVDLVVPGKNESDLCYFYGFDPSCDFFRVTNYSGFNGVPGDPRVSVEVLGQRFDDDDSLVRAVVDQLDATGFIDGGRLQFSNVTRLPAGFPMPSITNLSAMGDVGSAVRSEFGSHVIHGGIGSRPGLFFQNELLVDIHESISSHAVVVG